MSLNGLASLLALCYSEFVMKNPSTSVYFQIKTVCSYIALEGISVSILALSIPIGYDDHTVPIFIFDQKVRNIIFGVVLIPLYILPFAVPLMLGL